MACIAKFISFFYKDQSRYYPVPEVAIFTSFLFDKGMHTFRFGVFLSERGMTFKAAFADHLSLRRGTGDNIDTCAHEKKNHCRKM